MKETFLHVERVALSQCLIDEDFQDQAATETILTYARNVYAVAPRGLYRRLTGPASAKRDAYRLFALAIRCEKWFGAGDAVDRTSEHTAPTPLRDNIQQHPAIG